MKLDRTPVPVDLQSSEADLKTSYTPNSNNSKIRSDSAEAPISQTLRNNTTRKQMRPIRVKRIRLSATEPGSDGPYMKVAFVCKFKSAI